MKQLIRPVGFITFLIALLLTTLFWWLLADWLLKQSIEQGGTALLGSQVELANAEVTLSPLGFTLQGLQVTDPSDAMKNALQADTIHGSVSLLPLFMGQVVIDELRADGVAFATARSTPGIINKPAEAPPITDGEPDQVAPDLSMQLPDVDEILGRLPIQTIKLAEQFDHDSQQQLETIQQQLDALPDDQAMKAYEDRLKAAVESKVKDPADLKSRLAQLKQLKQELREERARLQALRDQIKTARSELSNQWKVLKQAPKQDLALLRENYSPQSRNLSNIAGLLFGSEVEGWVALIQPYLPYLQRIMSESERSEETSPPPPPRGEGRFVHFQSDTPHPDFWIKHAELTLALSVGNVAMQLRDVTHQPQVLGRPTYLAINAEKLPTIASIDIQGIADYRHPDTGYSELNGTIDSWQVKQFQLSGDSQYPIDMNGLQQLSGKLRLDKRGLDGKVKNHLQQVNWEMGSDPSRLQQLLGQVNDFSLDIELQGEINSPNIAISSDLDRRLGNVFKQQMKDEQAKLERRFNDRLNQEISQRAGKQGEYLQQLELQEGGLSQQLDNIEEMLKAEVKNDLDEKKDELKDKLKNKLRKLF